MQQLTIPPTADGETYIGAIGDKDGNAYHLIDMGIEIDEATFDDALAWAKEQGGDLPTRVEQAMLWANHRDLFQKDWYWSNESHHSDAGYAWCQGFSGGQLDLHKGSELRARAVRRLPIQ